MADLGIDTALDWRGRTVIDRDGEKVGTLKEIYLDEHERPHWGSIATGRFGTRETLAPLNQAQPAGDELQLPFSGDQIKTRRAWSPMSSSAPTRNSGSSDTTSSPRQPSGLRLRTP